MQCAKGLGLSTIFVIACFFTGGYGSSGCTSFLYSEFVGDCELDRVECINNNRSFYILPNATLCWPLVEFGEDDSHLFHWYSETSLILQKSTLNKSSLFVSFWKRKSSENEVVNAVSHYSSPISAMASATLAFLRLTQWVRVALITDIAEGLYLDTSEIFHKNINSKLDLHSFQMSNL